MSLKNMEVFMLMKNILLLSLFLTPFIVASKPLQRSGEFPLEQIKEQNNKIVQLVVEELSKNLPQTIDRYTKFVNISAKNSDLLYTFEINTGAKSDIAVQEEDKSRMEKAVITGVCRSSKRFLDAQINISYIYRSAKTKAKLFQFDITQEKCQQLSN